MITHFTFEEFVASQKAKEWKLDNTPPKEIMPKIIRTLEGMERVRAFLNHPIIINSGYRSPELNKIVGGSLHSQHMLGEACDFICPKFGKPTTIVKALFEAREMIGFDQLILEKTWVHISFSLEPRNQALTLTKIGYVKGV